MDSLNKRPKRRNMDEILVMESVEFVQGGIANDSFEGSRYELHLVGV
jgi:hypothetical protein